MDIQIQDKGAVSVSDAVFARDFNEGLVHQLVVSYMAAARQGTKAQKNRSAVSGGGAKPWRQKGTGRARAGTIRSPLWRSGGVTFAASPRDFSKKINKKQYRAGMQTIFSELVRQERLVVVEEMTVAEPKTKLLVEKLAPMAAKRVCIITEGEDQNLALAARNIPYTTVLDVKSIDPVSLVGADKVIVTAAGLKLIEEAYS